MLPPGVEDGVKILMSQSSQNTLVLYSKKGSTLLDELLKLIDLMLFYGAKPIQLAEFISNHESISKNAVQLTIEQSIKKSLSTRKNSKAKTKKVSDLIDMLKKDGLTEIDDNEEPNKSEPATS